MICFVQRYLRTQPPTLFFGAFCIQNIAKIFLIVFKEMERVNKGESRSKCFQMKICFWSNSQASSFSVLFEALCSSSPCGRVDIYLRKHSNEKSRVNLETHFLSMLCGKGKSTFPSTTFHSNDSRSHKYFFHLFHTTFCWQFCFSKNLHCSWIWFDFFEISFGNIKNLSNFPLEMIFCVHDLSFVLFQYIIEHPSFRVCFVGDRVCFAPKWGQQ